MGISGGVDSAVTAMLLKNQGYSAALPPHMQTSSPWCLSTQVLDLACDGLQRFPRAALVHYHASQMPQDYREVCLLCRHDVFGVFMRNWDESEEKGNDNCTVEADFTQAQSVCQHLGIPLHEVDFVRQYWTQVFSDFIAQVSPHDG